jgi:hypothetical protein
MRKIHREDPEVQESCCFKLLEKFDIFNENQKNNVLLDSMSIFVYFYIHIYICVCVQNTLCNHSNILFCTVMKKCPLYLRMNPK